MLRSGDAKKMLHTLDHFQVEELLINSFERYQSFAQNINRLYAHLFVHIYNSNNERIVCNRNYFKEKMQPVRSSLK